MTHPLPVELERIPGRTGGRDGWRVHCTRATSAAGPKRVMGRGPDELHPDRSFMEKMFPEEGTLQELKKLNAAAKEEEEQKEKATAEEKAKLLAIPRGKFAAFDQLHDILETGGSVAAAQRKVSSPA